MIVVGFGAAAVIVAFGLIWFFLWGMFENSLKTWQNGKVKVKQLELDIEREKTKQAELANSKK